jgi:hypothetical protein
VQFTVLRVPSVAAVADSATGPLRKSYETARDELRRDGCRAAGYRLAAAAGGEYPMCCRRLYGAWRMHIVFTAPDTLVIISIAEHTRRANPNAVLAELFPGLSATGRGRSDKPSCCDDPSAPPQLTHDILGDLTDLFRL